MKNTQFTRFFFRNYVLFLQTVCYSCVLAFSSLRSAKSLIIHVSRNIFSFPHIGCFCMHFVVSVPEMVKNTHPHTQKKKIYFFFSPLRVLFTLCRVWYLKNSKTLMIHVSRNVVLLHHTGCFPCILFFLYVRSLKKH